MLKRLTNQRKYEDFSMELKFEIDLFEYRRGKIEENITKVCVNTDKTNREANMIG